MSILMISISRDLIYWYAGFIVLGIIMFIIYEIKREKDTGERLPRIWQKNKLNLVLSNSELDSLEKYARRRQRVDYKYKSIAKTNYGQYLLDKIKEARK